MSVLLVMPPAYAEVQSVDIAPEAIAPSPSTPDISTRSQDLGSPMQVAIASPTIERSTTEHSNTEQTPGSVDISSAAGSSSATPQAQPPSMPEIEPLQATEPALDEAMTEPPVGMLPTVQIYEKATEDSSLFNPSVNTANLPNVDRVDHMTSAEWLALINGDDSNGDDSNSGEMNGDDVLAQQTSPPEQPFSSGQISAEEETEANVHSPSSSIGEGSRVRVNPTEANNPPDRTADLFESGWFDSSMDQVTSVSQLSDVQPTDWSYQALQTLVERYGIVAGYPDGTFRGDRPLTRYEFAAGLNAAIEAIMQLPAIATDGYATQADLATMQRLQDEFSAELATIRTQVGTLENRAAQLEAQQFSTTVKLGGEVVFGLAAAGGGDPPGTGDGDLVFTHLTQLQLAGSLSGRDAFRVGLSAGNFSDRGFAAPDNLNTNMALLGYQDDTNNRIELSSLEYRFAVGDRLVLTIKPVGFSLTSVLSPNSLFSGASDGALSRFAAFNPVFRIGGLEGGVGADLLLTDRVRLQVAYGARDASDSSQGLLASDHRALGVQLLTRPFNDVTAGIAYVNAFDENGFLNTFTGSNNADTSGGFNEPAAIHAIAGTFQWQINPHIVVGAWGGLIGTVSLESDAAALSTTYIFSLGLLDLFGREGDLLGVMVGQPPRLRVGTLIQNEDEGSGMHYEAFYRFRVNDNLSITPGFFIVTDPGHISSNTTIFVAALRTTLRF
jgi:hypothetical protein